MEAEFLKMVENFGIWDGVVRTWEEFADRLKKFEAEEAKFLAKWNLDEVGYRELRDSL